MPFIRTMDEIESYIMSRLRNTPELAKSYTSDGKHSYRYIYYRLKKYLKNFLENVDLEHRFIIMYGLRGIGKTTLLFQLYEELTLKMNFEKNNILYLPIDNLIGYTAGNLAKVISTYFEKFKKTEIPTLKEKIILMVDEAHFDEKWEVALKSLYDYDSSKNIFILVTGSSAIALNLSADTNRRAIKEPLFPLNFSEFELIKNKIFPIGDMTSELKELILRMNPTTLLTIQDKEARLNNTYEAKNLNITTEIEDFLKYGGFTTGVTNLANKALYYKQIMEVIRKIITIDLPTIKNFYSTAQQDIQRVIGQMAIKKAGETSHVKIANAMQISPTSIKQYFDALEKAHLIFSIKPYGKGAKKWAKTPWKYYFLSPTILCAIRDNLGADILADDTKGLVYETAVAAGLFRYSQTTSEQVAVLYDPKDEGNVDFLMKNMYSGTVIPIETGYNKHGDTEQLKSAIERFKSPYGILITNTPKTELQGNILKIPFTTFFLL